MAWQGMVVLITVRLPPVVSLLVYLGAHTSSIPLCNIGTGCFLAREISMLHNPAAQTRRDPEAVNAERDNAKQEPLDPLPEQANTCACELKLKALNVGMLGNPPLLQN